MLLGFFQRRFFVVCLVISMTFFQFAYSRMMNEDKLLFSPLNNQHLRVAAKEVPIDFYVTRNSTGHIIKFNGVSWMMLEWLSAAHINTTFSIVPYDSSIIPDDAFGGKPGIHDLLAKGEYDIMTSSTPTFSRAALVEFTQPVAYLPVSFLIPSSDLSSVNILSATKPFQTWVWISLFVTMMTVFASVIFLEKSRGESIKHSKLNTTFYILGILLYQAMAYRFNKKFAIRIVIASWSLGAFVLINLYNSLFISFLTIPITKPLIKSLEELQYRTYIRLVLNKNQNTVSLLLSAELGVLKGLGDRIRADPGSLCTKSSQCADLVKTGNTVYTATRDTFLLKALKEDFEATGKCNMEMGKENYMQVQISWAVQKKSPFLDSLNKSIMKMMEAGLIFGKWQKERLPKIEECFPTAKMKREKTSEGREPLPLKVYVGTFAIFFVGALFAVIVFFIETIIK